MPKPSGKPGLLAWQIIFIFILVAMALPLVGSRFVVGQIVKEQGLILQWYGVPRGTMINQMADKWFRACAQDSDLMNKTIYHFNDSDDSNNRHTAIPKTGGYDPQGKQIVVRDSAGRFNDTDWRFQSDHDENASKVKRVGLWWITAVFALCYFAFLRLAVLVAWLPMLVPLCISIVVTGYARQRLKWHGFGGVNPREYRAGGRLFLWFMGIGGGMFFAPGALPPVTVPVCVILVVTGAAFVLSNLQKPT